MNFKFLRGACLIIEGGGKRILTDPWLTQGEYYGAWAHYPAYEWKDDLSTLNYIYVSHIHPDHFSIATMKRLPKVPVLIHEFKNKFLKSNIEKLGFEVRELPHNTPTDLGGITINIIAADDCDAQVCGKFFGCDSLLVGDTQIDSLAVFDDGQHVYVNANDCPYQLSRAMLPKLQRQYPEIDMLFVAYAGAGPYPQCFVMSDYKKNQAARLKKSAFLQHAVRFAKDLRAKQTFPFAGDYVLCGRFADLNRYRGIASLSETYRYFDDQGVPVSRIDIYDDMERDRYIERTLSHREMDYERETVPDEKTLVTLMREAWKRLEKKRLELGFGTKTAIYISAGETMMRIGMNGTGTISQQSKIFDERYLKMSVDPRLLSWILSGPKMAHWNNAEIGSHIQFERQPDEFERGITHCLSFLHV